jgi:Uma2 family endonuclease
MSTNLAYQDVFREELIGGRVVAMSPATTRHNRIAENIDFIFRTYLKGKKCVPLGDGYNLYLTEQDRFIPDFMIVCERNKIKTKGVYGAPDLVVEVLSPSTAKNDKWYKKNVYEASGVPEYWIVNPNERSIEVYRLYDSRYVLENHYTHYLAEELEEMTVEEREALITEFHCHLYDDLAICLEDIFSDLF